MRTEVAAFEMWRRSGSIKPTIVGLRQRIRGTLAAELERTLPRLPPLSESEQRSLEKMLDSMTNKLAHRAISELKAKTGTPEGQALVETARLLFDLDEPPSVEGASDLAVASPMTPAPGREKAS